MTALCRSVVTKTGGGSFDPNDRRRYFLAVGPDDVRHINGYHTHVLLAVNDLNNDTRVERVKEVARSGTKVLLDSGIFNLAMTHARAHGVTHDAALNLAPSEVDGFGNLIERYLSLVTELADHLWGYIELDQGGRANKIKTRAELEGVGLRPIPVYHPFGDGWDYFDELASNYDRICLGNIVMASPAVRLRLLATVMERKKKYPHLWIHGLGLSTSQFHNAYPIDSCDSSSWLESVRWMQGYKERSAGAVISNCSRGFRYTLGDLEEHNKALRMAAYGASQYEANWRCATDEYAEWGML